MAGMAPTHQTIRTKSFSSGRPHDVHCSSLCIGSQLIWVAIYLLHISCLPLDDLRPSTEQVHKCITANTKEMVRT